MDPTPQRYEDPGGLLRPRLAVALQPHGLVEEFRLGQQTLTWWYDVVGVAWVDHDAAVLLLADGSRLALPVAADHAATMVESIEQRVRAAHAAWHQPDVRERCIAAWLGFDRDLPWHHDTSRQTQMLGVAILGLSALAAAVVGPAAVVGIGAGFAMILAAGLQSSRAWVARVDSLTWRDGHRTEQIDWADLREATLLQPGVVPERLTLRLVTEHVAFDVSGPADAVRRLANGARRIAAANAARFTSAGVQPVPDTALSPARLSEADSSRGLSATESN